MRALLLLLVGFGAGLATGLALQATPVRVRVTPPTVPADPAPERPAPAKPAPEPEAAVEPQGESRPEGEFDEPGMGRLVVDFTGLDIEPEFRVRVQAIDGSFEDWAAIEEEREAHLELRPGVYEPYWELPGRPGLWGARVRILAGYVTRIHAADPAVVFPAPVPRGLARVDLTVYGADGLPLPSMRVFLRGGDGFVDGHTNREGQVSLHVLPGDYSVEVGAGRLAVTARAGVATPVVMRPAGEGDLLFEMPDNSPRFRVRRIDGEELSYHDRVWWGYRTPVRRQQGYRYLPAGEYEVCWVRASGWPVAGIARVAPGQVTVFRGPPSGLTVLLPEHRGTLITLHIERLEDLEWRRFARIRDLGITDFHVPELRYSSPFMPPGRYRVWAESSKLRWATVEVVVGGSMIDIALHPEEPR